MTNDKHSYNEANEIPTTTTSSISTNENIEEVEEEEVEITFLEDFIAGGLAGSASVIVGHPFDTIKVRMQTSTSTTSKTATSGGISSLFRGMVAPLSMAAVINAVIFSSYASSSRVYDDWFLPSSSSSETQQQEEKKEKKKEEEDHVHGIIAEGGVFIEHDHHHQHNHHPQSSYQIGKNFVCGSIAGAIQTLVICPTEHVKCRLQTQQQQQQSILQNSTTITKKQQTLYKGPWDATKKILSQHGIQGLYRGFWCTCLREIPAFGAYFSTYDLVKDQISSAYSMEEVVEDSTRHAWMASAIAGGVSGSFTWGMIYPVDVIKSRIQTSSLEEGRRESMMTVGRKLVKEYGWRYMYRGLGVTLARAFPVNGIIFPVYEFVLMELRQGGI
uniref:Mitochondrial carrier protein n=2 Tax=Helicotheca tamesis TaxID=374047 RepID=A0A7S2MYG6_9STRA